MPFLVASETLRTEKVPAIIANNFDAYVEVVRAAIVPLFVRQVEVVKLRFQRILPPTPTRTTEAIGELLKRTNLPSKEGLPVGIEVLLGRVLVLTRRIVEVR